MKQPQSAGWKAIQQSNQDHNSPWKDILEGYFREFIAFFFPWIEKERGNLLEQERSNGDLIPFFYKWFRNRGYGKNDQKAVHLFKAY